jgi:hypothetical protein
MSRDRSDRPAAAGGAPDAAPAGDDLLTAYVDGVAELPVAERRAIEARLAGDPAARAEADAVAALLGQLRALPPDAGDEPDWQAMERSIRLAVADAPIRPWWRSWKWLVPAMTCATAAAVMLALWPRASSMTAGVPAAGSAPLVGDMGATDTRHREPAHEIGREPAAGDGVVALWLDGGEVDVDLSRTETAGGLGDLLGGDAPDGAEAPDAAAGGRDDLGLWPATGMAWVDNLDDAALDRVEHWLESPQTRASQGKKKG